MAPVQVQPQAQCSAAADSLYNEGMNRMAAGDDAGASTLFGRVLELCPSHPTAAEMRRNAEQHAQARAGVATTTGTVQPVGNGNVTVQGTGAPSGTITVEGQGGMNFLAPVPNYNLVYGPDPVTLGARLNLVIGQTLFGMALGAFVPITIGGNGVRAEHIGGGILLGGALGAAGSLVASLNGVTQGQAIAVNFGSGVGLGLGAGVAMLTGLRDMQLTFGLFAAGQALGTAAGAILALQRPLSGKMAYISSLAGWGTMATFHVYMGVTNLAAGSIEAAGGMLLGGLAAGTIAGALSAPFVNVSADRLGWINLSMAAGWLVVGSAAGLFAISSGSGNIAYAWGSIAGVGLGAVFGVLMTRDTDRYWHQAREQQTQQAQPGVAGRQARHQPTQRPMTTFMPGGPGNTPMGFTIAGTF